MAQRRGSASLRKKSPALVRILLFGPPQETSIRTAENHAAKIKARRYGAHVDQEEVNRNTRGMRSLGGDCVRVPVRL